MSVPFGLLDAFIRMLPRLEAEEAIDGASRAAASWGGEGGAKLLAGWTRQAAGPEGPGRAVPASGDDLARMGIRVVVAPPAGHISAEGGSGG
jgi:hypothetical protein